MPLDALSHLFYMSMSVWWGRHIIVLSYMRKLRLRKVRWFEGHINLGSQPGLFPWHQTSPPPFCMPLIERVISRAPLWEGSPERTKEQKLKAVKKETRRWVLHASLTWQVPGTLLLGTGWLQSFHLHKGVREHRPCWGEEPTDAFLL